MINVNKLTFFPPLTTGCYSGNFTNLKIFGFATDGRRKHRENSEVRNVFFSASFLFQLCYAATCFSFFSRRRVICNAVLCRFRKTQKACCCAGALFNVTAFSHNMSFYTWERTGFLSVPKIVDDRMSVTTNRLLFIFKNSEIDSLFRLSCIFCFL